MLPLAAFIRLVYSGDSTCRQDWAERAELQTTSAAHTRPLELTVALMRTRVVDMLVGGVLNPHKPLERIAVHAADAGRAGGTFTLQVYN